LRGKNNDPAGNWYWPIFKSVSMLHDNWTFVILIKSSLTHRCHLWLWYPSSELAKGGTWFRLNR